jgi:transposase
LGRTAKKEISKGGERMSTRSMMDVTEIVNELGVSKAFAYNLIKKFNNELKQKGFTTITGKVSRKYFEEQFYGMSDTNKEGA